LGYLAGPGYGAKLSMEGITGTRLSLANSATPKQLAWSCWLVVTGKEIPVQFIKERDRIKKTDRNSPTKISRNNPTNK